MFSGRHLIFLGVLACAGLISVRDGQTQVRLGYDLAEMEDRLQKTEQEIEVERARLQALRVPEQVLTRVHQLRLEVVPPSELDPYASGDPARSEQPRGECP